MTKTAMKMRELTEAQRHNEAMEREAHRGNTISAVTGTLSALSKPVASLISKGGSMGKVLGSTSGKGDLAKEFADLLGRKSAGERLPDADYKRFLELQKLMKGGHK